MLGFFVNYFLYIYIMNNYTRAELYGKVQELQHDIKQLKNQLILTQQSNERNKR